MRSMRSRPLALTAAHKHTVFLLPPPSGVLLESMSVEVARPTMPCAVCGAAVSELRRGRCWGRYTRWAEARPVGRGAVCTICFEKRRDQLRLVELQGRSLPLCHGCASRLARLPDMPPTIESIRRVLRRDRRDDER